MCRGQSWRSAADPQAVARWAVAAFRGLGVVHCPMVNTNMQDEVGLVRSNASPWLLRAYRHGRLRRWALRQILRREGGEYRSATLRQILLDQHGVRIGAYSYGKCCKPGLFPGGVTVGRYCSIADGVHIFLRNHPYERLSTHPYFYNKRLGVVAQDTIEDGELAIGHDVWVGFGAIVTPSCRRIGVGAIVGAGAVVTKDVPDFAIVAGNPARLIRYRFTEVLRERLLASRWWDRSVEELVPYLPDLLKPLTEWGLHPLLENSTLRSPAGEA